MRVEIKCDYSMKNKRNNPNEKGEARVEGESEVREGSRQDLPLSIK